MRPSLANTFVSHLEKHWYYINKPIVYVRFIDDILLINNSEINLIDFSNQFDNLKLNITSGTSVNFLDLQISLNNLTNLLDFKLYTKPTNTFNYLYFSSNHPESIFNNILKSLFIRIRRISSSLPVYLYFLRILISQLVKRGFNFFKINKISNTIAGINR